MQLDKFANDDKTPILRGAALRWALGNYWLVPLEWNEKHDYDGFLKALAAELGDEYLLRPDGDELRPRAP